jgi:hypothetical protein
MGWGVVQTVSTAGNGGPEAVPYQVLSHITKNLHFVFVTSVSKQEYKKYAFFNNATKGNTRTICF